MATLFKNSWPLGWTPNADEFNGDPRGLLRADNLTYDEDGVLTLIRGTRKVSGVMPSEPTQIYGKMLDLNGVTGSPGGYPAGLHHLRYLVIGDDVLRNFGALKNEDAYDQGIISGGGDQGAAFGFGSGHVFVTYGSQRVKDDGITQTPIGMVAAAQPGVAYNAAPSVVMRGPNTNYIEFAAKEAGGPPDGSGTDVFDNTSTYVEIGTSEENRAVAVGGQFVTIAIDAMALNGVADTGRDEDIYKIEVRINNTSTLVKVRVEYLMQEPEVVGFNPDATDYYWYEWLGESGQFNAGIHTWTTLECKRSDFQRHGTDSTVNWQNIKGIRITFVSTEYQQNAFTNPRFVGGTNGPLNGTYTYIQVNVQDNGYYTEKSLFSIQSDEVRPINTSIHVIPSQLDLYANEAWIFRGGGNLGGFYRVKVIPAVGGTDPAEFDDIMTDEQALALNIQLDYYQQNLPDGIIGMETNFKGRNWYMTYERIYPSYRDNVSSYDSRYVIDTAGNTEYNLFITKLSIDTMILATNQDFYEISGSAGVITDGNIEYFDLTVRSLGIKTPAISKAFTIKEGNLFYLASDGIRVLAGTSCQLVTNEIDLLFNNYTRYEIAPTKLIPNEPIYHLGIGNNRLYFSTQLQDNRRALFVFNFVDKMWRFEDHGDDDSINALFVEEDNTVIYSTASFGDMFVRVLDTGTLLDESDNINFKFLTVFDHNGQPRNRKDSFTLKVRADTEDTEITLILRGHLDDGSVLTFTEDRAFDGRTEQLFSIYTELNNAVKYYQLELSGTVPKFKLYDFSIDYEPRPEQLTDLRIPPSNFGVAGRKRVPEIPMIIDTMGLHVHFNPILDGVVQTQGLIQTFDRTVYHYLFPGDKTAYNVGGILTSPTGDVFEFYELVSPREVELIPDPLLFKWVPYTNLGTSSRKRFIQYAIIIDTRGQDVQLIPYIDGQAQEIKVVNTDNKRTAIAVMPQSAIGIDIACQLTALSAIPFEFYGISLDDSVFEKLPPISKYLTLKTTNFGCATRKRIRTIPFSIDTRGGEVRYTPEVDGVQYPSSTFVTNGKRTVLHYFTDTGPDEGVPFGIDYGGTLDSFTDFEFYEMLSPANVETLPMGKMFDQIGPVEFSKVGKIREIQLRLLSTASVMNFKIFASDVVVLRGSFETIAEHERTYTISVPKGINPNIFRMEFDAPSVFHRFDAEVKVNVDGAQTQNKRIRIKGPEVCGGYGT